jgi:hypothetical protein
MPVRPNMRELASAGWRAPWLLPCLIVAVVTGAVLATGVRGADYPAHLLRAWLWDRSGLGVWNNYWYGGHSTPGYSVITPALTAWFGPVAVVAVASLVSTWAFSTLTERLAPGPTTRVANAVFALGAGVNIVVGRVPFALGFALTLIALLVWQRGHVRVAAILALVTPLASPVAAVFLGIAAGAVALDSGRHIRAGRMHPDRSTMRAALVVGAAAVMPLLVFGVLFGSVGRFPFRTAPLLGSLVVIGFLAWRFDSRTVRAACVLSALASLAVWAVPNPLGGNFLRLAHLVGIPLGVIAIAALDDRGRRWFGLLAVVGVAWAVTPGVQAVVAWSGDESTAAEFHRPLVDQVEARNRDGRPLGRLEIPFTDNHWESWFVATEVPFARGWERQVDLDRNEELYELDGDTLTLDDYHAWLHRNAVRWIARPDVALDEGGEAEAELVDAEGTVRDVPWLRLVWRNDDWKLYEVVDYVPIVDPPAVLVRQDADAVVLSTDRPATTTVRFEYNHELAVDGGACLAEDADGWIVARLPGPGTYRIDVEAREALPAVESDDCT